jgi:sugar phosphate isomerase/epimerase
MMKLGLDDYSYHIARGYGSMVDTPMTMVDTCERAAAFGLEGVMIELRDHELDQIPAARQAIDRLGLFVEAQSGGTHPDHLRRRLESAKALGATVMRTFIGGSRYDDDPPEVQLRGPTEDLKQVAPIAEEFGILIAVENHIDWRAEELLAVVREVDSEWIGICLDTGNGFGTLEDPLAVAEMLAPYSYTTHFKDFKLVPTEKAALVVGTALGEGSVDLRRVVDILRERAPDPNLNIEAALDNVEVPLFREGFWRGYPGMTPEQLSPWLAYLCAGAADTHRDWRTPKQKGAPAEEAIAAEHDLVARSVKYCREVLGV